MTQQAGLGQGNVEDGAMSIFEFGNGLIAQTHDAFTTRYASTGLEIYGTHGSLIGTDVMTQEPIGEVILKTESGSETLPVERFNLYEVGLNAFGEAIAGRGAPAASGADGLRSLAASMAAVESSRTGRKVEIAL